MRRTVDKALAQKEPRHVWNAFVDLLAMEEYADLTDLQRKAHLVFWYDSEVGNGGHDQYFGNRGTEQVGATIEALRELGLPRQAEVLLRALSIETSGGNAPGCVDCDLQYGSCLPTVTEALQRHLQQHQSEYVELV